MPQFEVTLRIEAPTDKIAATLVQRMIAAYQEVLAVNTPVPVSHAGKASPDQAPAPPGVVSVRGRGIDGLVVICHAIEGDGTINCYSGPDTPEVRDAIANLDELHGPGMFEIGDGLGVCDSAKELLDTLDWWAMGGNDPSDEPCTGCGTTENVYDIYGESLCSRCARTRDA
jgi:hypothetical protein